MITVWGISIFIGEVVFSMLVAFMALGVTAPAKEEGTEVDLRYSTS